MIRESRAFSKIEANSMMNRSVIHFFPPLSFGPKTPGPFESQAIDICSSSQSKANRMVITRAKGLRAVATRQPPALPICPDTYRLMLAKDSATMSASIMVEVGGVVCQCGMEWIDTCQKNALSMVESATATPVGNFHSGIFDEVILMGILEEMKNSLDFVSCPSMMWREKLTCALPMCCLCPGGPCNIPSLPHPCCQSSSSPACS